MGFDENSNRPLMNPKRRTTKVNFAIVVAVLAFFMVSAFMLIRYSRSPEKTVPKAERQATP